ncbi:MAG TPA: formylglycine-generating enzyme family protein [Burkholderiales bacterium]|nr:formylglycine-generating enzyme family protein [Burkholderiales bacterium]
MSEIINLPQPVQQLIEDMVEVTGGSFQMGKEKGPKAAPQHSVYLSAFSIAKYPVTQAQWVAVMGDNPSYFKGENLPMDSVNWEDIQEFLTKLNTLLQRTTTMYRLPTEAEWEYAAKGGQKSKGFLYAGSNDVDDVAWYKYKLNGYISTHPVGTKAANELGLYDMSGNVWEWCNDWYDENYYSNSPTNNPTGPTTGTFRILRGGSWYDVAEHSQITSRNYLNPAHRFVGMGFRIVL